MNKILIFETFYHKWYGMKEVAKMLNFKKIGRTKLFRLLREENILMESNEPLQKYIDKGYFKIKDKDIFNLGGKFLFSENVTLVSFEGIKFIHEILIKKEEPKIGK